MISRGSNREVELTSARGLVAETSAPTSSRRLVRGCRGFDGLVVREIVAIALAVAVEIHGLSIRRPGRTTAAATSSGHSQRSARGRHSLVFVVARHRLETILGVGGRDHAC
jgi:hypothetical protein